MYFSFKQYKSSYINVLYVLRFMLRSVNTI